MLKKIYKNNGYIYLNDNNNCNYNNIYLKNYIKYKDSKSLEEIKNISKKEYYNSLKCAY